MRVFLGKNSHKGAKGRNMNRRIQQLKTVLNSMDKDAIVRIMIRICESNIQMRQEIDSCIISGKNAAPNSLEIDQKVFNQIATTLAGHYDSVYYVDIENGEYTEFVPPLILGDMRIPDKGEDFFAMSQKNAHKCVHPDDLEQVLHIHRKEVILENVSSSGSYSVNCRLVIGGKVIHVRHIAILCEDRKHILCCMENTDDEIRTKEEQLRNLQSAERMAWLDELTGIKNKNAFTEHTRQIDRMINAKPGDFRFGIVVCDINDLKLMNDTRGHSFGDEAIQKASRLVCNVFTHSPVFRIGGDEFAVVITDSDYAHRDRLLSMLREEAETNRRFRSGPVVASGMAVYEPETDDGFSAVLRRADQLMYENKKELKALPLTENTDAVEKTESPIPETRVRQLDRLFGAFYTVAGGGYVYLNDMRYDYSRFSLPLIYDFDLTGEYMYHADSIWQDRIHPDDITAYREAVDAVLSSNAQLRPLSYRARKADGSYVLLTTRCFVMTDDLGKPEYFGGIMIPQ